MTVLTDLKRWLVIRATPFVVFSFSKNCKHSKLGNFLLKRKMGENAIDHTIPNYFEGSVIFSSCYPLGYSDGISFRNLFYFSSEIFCTP